MQNNKTPGNDDLTEELYVCFFIELGKLLVETLNLSYENGELKYIPKAGSYYLDSKEKDKDSRLIKNWRPISLINVDVKVASKALAKRTKKVTHNIIHCNQAAYVKGRYIGESVRLI